MKFILILFLTMGLNGCMTTESNDFVNYKEIGDVYTTKPQTVDYEEVGNIVDRNTGFFWNSCESVCKEAIKGAKDKSKNHGGDSIVELRFKNGDGEKVTEPTCLTSWLFWVLPTFKRCAVSGIAVSRVEQKNRLKNAQEKQIQGNPINININNTQNNSGEQKPAH